MLPPGTWSGAEQAVAPASGRPSLRTSREMQQPSHAFLRSSPHPHPSATLVRGLGGLNDLEAFTVSAILTLKMDLPHPFNWHCSVMPMFPPHPLWNLPCVQRSGETPALTISRGGGSAWLCALCSQPQALHMPGPAQHIHQHGLQPWAAASPGHTCSHDFSPHSTKPEGLR